MKLYHRDFIFESNDFEDMCKFIIQDNTKRKEYFIWHIGRIVDWKYNLFNFKKHFPKNFNKAAHLWFNCFGDLIGFVISEGMNNEFTIFLKDEYCFFYSDLINWVVQEWGNNYDTLVTQTVENQHDYIVNLLNLGFTKTDNIEMTRIFDTIHYKDYVIDDPSVMLHNMYENKDYIEQANLQNSAWPKTIDLDLNLQIREYLRSSPIYNPQFDFILVNKEKRHISGCEAFIDYENNTAEIERVCTHSSFHNKGYAKIILKACMRELYKNKIMTAFITGTYDKTIYLYGKLGHVKEITKYFYKLEKNRVG